MNLSRKHPPRGAELLTATLECLGVEHVFGLPGTQNVALFEALRRSRLQTVVASHELGASFMANGYARASGRPGVLVTIPGPGFTYALTGLAEARLDSAPIVHIVGRPATSPGQRFQLQAIDQATMAGAIAKAVLVAGHAGEIPAALVEAHRLAISGEPGPVVLEVAAEALTGHGGSEHVGLEPGGSGPVAPGPPIEVAAPPRDAVEAIAALVAAAPRIVIYAGQGTAGDPAALLRLAETLGAAVATTTSARGVVPEDHPLAVRCDGESERLNTLVARADLVLALGVKFSHNGAHGFRLTLDRDRLVHVDASTDVLNGHYPSRIAVACDVPAFVRELGAVAAHTRPGQGWTAEELASVRRCSGGGGSLEPAIPGINPPTPAGFFAALRETLPRDAILVTDSGLHQMLARRHFQVLAPRGFITPSDFQSMGFALPAAIGAKLAHPKRTVVALLGDGGLAMSGMELLTAVRERIPLTVIAVVDGHYGLIRLQQLRQYGHAHGTKLANPDFARWAASLGVDYVLLDGIESLRTAVAANRPTLLEVAVRDSVAIRTQQVKSLARETALSVAGASVSAWWRSQRRS